MLDVINQFHFHIGKINIGWKNKKERRNFGVLIFILGIVLFLSPVFKGYLPEVILDILSKIGLILFIAGALLNRI